MHRRGGGLGRAALFAFIGGLSLPSPAASEGLGFLRQGETVARITRSELVATCEAQVVSVDDPYYGRAKRFHAVALDCALRRGFGAVPAATQNVFLRAKDGYTRPVAGQQLAEAGAWIAFADADRSRGDPGAPEFEASFEPIDRRQIDPAPFYLVWSGEGQNDPHRHPWPYQLAEIEIAPLAQLFPHVAPPDVSPESPAALGFALFRGQCMACHAINGEGGTVGPDLNVPRSIVEYRPIAQIKAYIRDPASFRYTTMPAHPGLSDADLDALIAYFDSMSRAKHDPGRE